jgi:hypothetical protein
MRVGEANFYRSGSNPVGNNAIWRDAVKAEQMRHPYHALNMKLRPMSYVGIKSETHEAFANTWQEAHVTPRVATARGVTLRATDSPRNLQSPSFRRIF